MYFVFISKLDNQFVNVSFVYSSSQMCQLVVHDSILVDNFEWEACIHVNSTALRGSLSLFGSWLSEWKYLMALKFQTWNSLMMLNNNNLDKRDNLTYAFSDKHIEKMFGNQFWWNMKSLWMFGFYFMPLICSPHPLKYQIEQE